MLIKPNFSYTVKEIKQDVVRVFNTGIFKEVTPETVDTRDGISLTFKLVANPVIRGLVIKGCNELPVNFCQDLFRHQFGKVLNSNYVVAACDEISKWYDHRKMPVEWYGVQVDDVIMEIGVEEPRIGEVEIRFLDRKTGEPCGHEARDDHQAPQERQAREGAARPRARRPQRPHHHRGSGEREHRVEPAQEHVQQARPVPGGHRRSTSRRSKPPGSAAAAASAPRGCRRAGGTRSSPTRITSAGTSSGGASP